MQPSSETRFGIRAPGHRLPDDLAIGVVRLQVGDLSRSLDFYQGTLGLTRIEDGGGAAALAPQQGGRVLLELHERRGAKPVPRRGLLGLFHFAILLPDRASLGRFIAHVARRPAAMGLSDHTVSEAVYLSDPDGLGIEVYADRPRKSWRADPAGQLVMTTEPLDVTSLIAAAEGGEWTGMPSGAVMGHVHLHVGDLDAAEAFYHRALGLDKTVWTYPGALFFSAGGYHHHLGTNTWSHGGSPSAEHAQLLSWEIVVPGADDAAAAARSLEASGHPVVREGQAFIARDPWGTGLRVAW